MPQGPLTVATVQLAAAYYQQAQLGKIFGAFNSAAVTTSAALATTYVGCCLSNPAGSGKNLALLRVSGGLIVAPSTITSMMMITGFSAAGVTVHTTALTPFATMLGETTTTPVAKADSACTIVGTPAWATFLAQCGTATTSTSFTIDLQGAIVIPPGGYAAIGTNIASPASAFQGGFMWAEV